MEQGQADEMVRIALEGFQEQIDESESMQDGVYFFALIALPKSDQEATQLRYALDEDRSVWGNEGNDNSPLLAEGNDLDIRYQDSMFFGTEDCKTETDLRYHGSLKMQRSQQFAMLESQKRELVGMTASELAE